VTVCASARFCSLSLKLARHVIFFQEQQNSHAGRQGGRGVKASQLYMMLTTKTGLSYTSTIGTGIETRLGLSYKAQQKGLRPWQCQRRMGRRKCRTKGGVIKRVGLGGGLYLQFCVTSLKPPALSRL
jgi:hypothetical protein